MKQKNNRYTMLFVVLLYIYTFRNIIISRIRLFQYADELLAMIGLFCLMISIFGTLKIKKENMTICVGLFLFVFSGMVSSIVYRYQPLIKIVLPDLLISTKFFLWVYVAIFICKKHIDDYERLFCILAKHSGYLLLFLFVLTVVDEVFHIFNQYVDIKMGMRAVGLYEGAAALASTSASLMCLSIIGQKKLKWSKEIIFGLCVLLATLRFKSLAAIAVFIVVFFYGKVIRKKIQWWHFFVLGAIAVFVAKDQIAAVFSSGVARYVLYAVGFKIMWNYFPIGTGFGTYASYYSKVRYSPVYEMYNISTVYGLSKEKGSFINDTFWPMVLGQTGVIGTIGYGLAIYWIYCRIQKCKKINTSLYYGGMYAFLYLLITSSSESAFLHWNAVMFALILGIISAYSFGEKRKCNEIRA